MSLSTAATAAVNELVLTQPDDWHHHLRDGAKLDTLVPAASKRFRRCIVMPNLVPPVRTTDDALAYRDRIMAAVPKDGSEASANFQPLMTIYLTDSTPPEEIVRAKESGKVFAVKLYPAGATTNSASGVTDIEMVVPTLEKMAELGLPLLVHGEVTDPEVDIFDREKVYIDRILRPLVKRVPQLRVVMEHITTADAVEFVLGAGDNVAATITPQHLTYNRNALFQGGINVHRYCLPVLKAERHRQALLGALGSKKFFLGTDSAPHARGKKESACGCAGCFNVHSALSLYARAFEKMGKLDKLEEFVAFNGPDFYGLPRNTGKITLRREAWTMPQTMDLILEGNEEGATPCLVRPFEFGETIEWKNDGIDDHMYLVDAAGSGAQVERDASKRAKEAIMATYEQQFAKLAAKE